MEDVGLEDESHALKGAAEVLLPDVLDDEDKLAIGIVWHIIRLAKRVEQRFEFEVHRPLGWSWAGFRVMFNTFVLGDIEPSQLASVLRVSRPTVTSTIDKLERDGFLQRRPDPTNGRRVLVSVTDRGREAVLTGVPMQLAIERETVSGLTSAESAALRALLRGLLLAIQKEPEGLYLHERLGFEVSDLTKTFPSDDVAPAAAGVPAFDGAGGESRGEIPLSERRLEDELSIVERFSERFFDTVLDEEDRVSRDIVWHMIRLAKRVEQRFELEVHRPLGWSWAGFRVMFNAYILGEIEPSQLASVLRVSRPTVTSTIDKLERDGFLQRRPDPTNGRRVLVSMTDRGREAVRTAAPRQLSIERETVSGLTPAERVALRALLHGLHRALRRNSLT